MTGAYLDHAATTPLRPEARAAMEPLLDAVFGNPSGSHAWARQARRLLDDAREEVAEVLGAHPAEVVFTSGGTEADNLAVTGALAARRRVDPGAWALCSAVEHHAVLEPTLVAGGERVTVDSLGALALDALAYTLERAGAGVVALMAANNEVGTVQPVAEAAAIVRAAAPGAHLHVDAVAAAPWVDLAPLVALADSLAVSGHKVGGPKGIGALVLGADVDLIPQLRGGGQEAERRSGTPNVAGAVGFAAALRASAVQRDETVARVEALRARLSDGLRRSVDDLVLTSPEPLQRRLPSILHVCIPGVDREALLFLLDQAGVCASAASACAAGAMEPSHVLHAMGVPRSLAQGSVRLTLGPTSTQDDIDHGAAVLVAAVHQLRRTSPASAARPT